MAASNSSFQLDVILVTPLWYCAAKLGWQCLVLTGEVR